MWIWTECSNSSEANDYYTKMNDPTPKTEASAVKAPAATFEVPIHFIKATNFRVIHASGVWFGGDVQQNLHLTFYSERSPIPKKIVLKVNEQGMAVGEDESKRESKVGVIREMEVDIVLSVPAAVDLHKALGDNLKNVGVIK